MRRMWAAGSAIVMCLALGGLPVAGAGVGGESGADHADGDGRVHGNGHVRCRRPRRVAHERTHGHRPLLDRRPPASAARSPERWATTRSAGPRATGPARGCSSASAAIPRLATSWRSRARGHTKAGPCWPGPARPTAGRCLIRSTSKASSTRVRHHGWSGRRSSCPSGVTLRCLEPIPAWGGPSLGPCDRSRVNRA